MSASTMVNPYKGWLAGQQSRGAAALKGNGQSTFVKDPSAVCWCAHAWLINRDVPATEISEFSNFLINQTGNGLIMSNDDLRLTPRQFEALWDQWKAPELEKES